MTSPAAVICARPSSDTTPHAKNLMGNSALKRQEALVQAGTLKKHGDLPEWATSDSFTSMQSLQNGLRNAGLESSNLIVAVDFTKSNRTQGAKSFGGKCLHAVDEDDTAPCNPYTSVIRIVGESLSPFDDDGRIPALYFGDTETRHTACRPFRERPCQGMDEVLEEYKRHASTP